jgi:hypothetical protein
MTEQEWRTCTDPKKMLEFLRGKASDRKLRLFACAFCRSERVWGVWLLDARSLQAVEVAERFVDGEATRKELDAARVAAWAPVRLGGVTQVMKTGGSITTVTGYHFPKTAWATARDGVRAADAAVRAGRVSERAFQCHLLRDIFGPHPFRPDSLTAAVLAWNGGAIRRMAEAIYEERQLPAGTLDTARLSILADALEEAGCMGTDLLAHCRGPGPHWRGCWALDALLAKG